MSLGILPQNTCKERHYAIEKQNRSKYGNTKQEKKKIILIVRLFQEAILE